MPEPDAVDEVVHQWVIKAEHDLITATHTLKLRENCPTDTVCFHAQQCVEKYLKAILVQSNIDFPKVHDLMELIALLPPRIRPKLLLEDQRRLTEYATVARYPGDYEVIPLVEARRAVQTARRVRESVRKLLNKTALQKQVG